MIDKFENLQVQSLSSQVQGTYRIQSSKRWGKALGYFRPPDADRGGASKQRWN